MGHLYRKKGDEEELGGDNADMLIAVVEYNGSLNRKDVN
jgi:hypothetical protein